MAADGSSPSRERDEEQDVESQPPTEQTPLISRDDQTEQSTNDARPPLERSATSALFFNLRNSGKGAKRRWPSMLALFLLCIVAILIMVFAFFTPSIVEKYAQQAVVFEPTDLSIDSFSATGVRARVRGDFSLDGSRVRSQNVRNLGRFGTWIAREAESGESEVEVSLPEYGNVVLGTAIIPSIKVDLRDGHTTHVDFLAELTPGDLDGVRRIANDWIEGRLGRLHVLGKANVPIHSGILSFGTQSISHEIFFNNDDVPTIPKYKIQKLNVHEIDVPTGKGMAADVALKVDNPYPVEFTVPPLAFAISVENCQPTDPYIMLADAHTKSIEIHPKADVGVNVTGVVRQLPDMLTQACPGSGDSPLDQLLGDYIHGKDTTIYVRGSDSASSDTPKWVTDITSSVTVPVSVPGRTFGHLIRNFSMADTHFSLPDPFAEPDTPEAQPQISAVVRALVALPEEMNFNLTVGRVRANARVFYKGRQLGTLDIPNWQPANSTRVPPENDDEGPGLLVESAIKDVPLNITDEDVFTDVIQALLFGSKSVVADLKANVDVGVDTALGDFAIRKIPAEGKVPIKPISPNNPSKPGGRNDTSPSDIFRAMSPRIYDIGIVSTTKSALTLSALVNITNPTLYSATIPYLSLHVMTNDTILANASVQHLAVNQGNNTALKATATWDPEALGGGQAALRTGIELLSQYISGFNTTLTLKLHEASIPSNPLLSRALGAFNLTVPTPRLPGHDEPDKPRKDGPRLIEQARFHLLSSTASFVLRSPLQHTTLFITDINATALYKGSPVGRIEYDLPFAVQPVDDDGNGSETPRLPVDWERGGAGWDAVRKAIGGRLKIAAEAVVGIGIGEWRLQGIWFKGHGLGVGVGL